MTRLTPILLTAMLCGLGAMSPKQASQQKRAVNVQLIQPAFSVGIAWKQPPYPVSSNLLSVTQIGTSNTTQFLMPPTNSATVTAPSNTVRIEAYAYSNSFQSNPSNVITNRLPAPVYVTNIYRVQPKFSTDLDSWANYGSGWSFTNAPPGAAGYWRLDIIP